MDRHCVKRFAKLSIRRRRRTEPDVLAPSRDALDALPVCSSQLHNQ
jgi:hypothetical protein